MNLRYGLQSVLSGKFRLANPLRFNDPFESARVVVSNLDPDIRKIYGDESCTAESVTKGIVGMMRFLCLSRDEGLSDNGDVLLWSHYADSGNGIRVGLNVEGLGYELRDVVYGNERPTLDLVGISVNDVHKKLAQIIPSVYSYKGESWSYENEKRICVMLNAIHPRINVSDAGEVYCCFPPNHIMRVDFGAKLSYEECISTALTICARDDLRHVEFRRAVIDRNKFRYYYESINIQKALV